MTIYAYEEEQCGFKGKSSIWVEKGKPKEEVAEFLEIEVATLSLAEKEGRG